MTDYSLYDEGIPPVVAVWCSPNFRDQTSALFHACTANERAHFATVNALVKRFAAGEKLSTDAFRQEQTGYAFRSGTIRFYGAYSNAHAGCFVLSHSINKRQQKLSPGDAAKMKKCVIGFDQLQTLPAITPRKKTHHKAPQKS